MRKVPKTCTVCEKHYVAQRHESKYCSKGCFNTAFWKKDPVEQFHSGYVISPCGCWLWQKRISDGYGAFKNSGVQHRAHRFAYELYKGSIPEGLCVLHNCHKRACVNPEHLRLGTIKDNVDDDLRRGVHSSQVPTRKWKAIRFMGESYPSIARAADLNGINRSSLYYYFRKLTNQTELPIKEK